MKNKLLNLFIIFSIFSSISSCSEDKPIRGSHCENNNIQYRCPKMSGTTFVPKYFPAKSIFVGYSNDRVHLEFLNLLISEILKLKERPKLNILIPRLDEQAAFDTLNKFFDSNRYDFLNFIPTSADETVWAQDYFETVYNADESRQMILDLPYIGREGETIPNSISLACKSKIITQAKYEKGENPGNGEYGGNIEAITTKLIMIGNNMASSTYSKIQSTTLQEIVDVDVSWLETGHVDELFTALPIKKNAKACDQILLMASPAEAFKILDKLPKDHKEYDSKFATYYDDYDVWPNLYKCLNKKYAVDSKCKKLKEANLVYEKLIQISADAINKKMQQHHGCNLNIEKFPQIFVPLDLKGPFGKYEDRAISLNPNSVNNIYFSSNLLLAKQDFDPFENHVNKVLKKYPFNVIHVDGQFVHELNGGIHCATNINYGCRP